MFIIVACGSKSVTRDSTTKTDNSIIHSSETTSTETLSLSNPASVNCVTMKGTLKTVTRNDGSQYNVCYFIDNRQCEEWALLRGDCPINGRKITGYDTEEQRYCVITGGQVDINKNTCTFQGQNCDLGKYYDGACN